MSGRRRVWEWSDVVLWLSMGAGAGVAMWCVRALWLWAGGGA